MLAYLSQVYIYGFREGFNPYSFVIVLFFLLYLTVTSKDFKDLIINGITFLLSVAFIYGLISAGLFDVIVLKNNSILFFRHIYLYVGFFYVIFALLNAADWFNLKRKKEINEQIIPLPSVLKTSDEAGKHPKKIITRVSEAIWILIGQVITCILVFSQTIWPVDVYIYRMFFVIQSEGTRVSPYLFFGVYTAGYLFFLVLVWLCFLWFVRKIQPKMETARSLSWFKIIVASLYFSVGAGIICLFYL